MIFGKWEDDFIWNTQRMWLQSADSWTDLFVSIYFVEYQGQSICSVCCWFNLSCYVMYLCVTFGWITLDNKHVMLGYEFVYDFDSLFYIFQLQQVSINQTKRCFVQLLRRQLRVYLYAAAPYHLLQGIAIKWRKHRPPKLPQAKRRAV